MSHALIFAGQGAQKVGMGKSLYDGSAAARALYDEANSVLGWDLKKVSFEGPDAELTQTKVCQPALFVHGLALLAAKISHHLVPTLVESFALTVAIIFATFLVVFRSGAARVMAIIPSLFAILVMFGVMRVTGMSLNVATILIASTVLGTSENDQIHFFYHFQEKRKDASVEQSLKHTLRVAGKAIVFATLINAGGFLAFAVADLPPIRQFGALSSLAFVLSMIADFTALPAALWIVFRAKPDAHLPKKDDGPADPKAETAAS